MILKDLKIGKEARVIEILGESAIRRRIMDIGILPGAKLTIIKRAPFGGDPIQINILNCDLIIRNSEAKNIIVTAEES
ncbi:MAG: FeoA domain-containing protein [Oscillospiraceae bacterium]|jgi:Fe2+ transport system protein FeoA|nr:FeoA domain-containing protein [Oscillospiraceae bacterium]